MKLEKKDKIKQRAKIIIIIIIRKKNERNRYPIIKPPSGIKRPIRILQNPISTPLIPHPISRIILPSCSNQNSLSMEHTRLKITLISHPTRKHQFPVSMRLIILKSTSKTITVRPVNFSFPMFSVVKELSTVFVIGGGDPK